MTAFLGTMIALNVLGFLLNLCQLCDPKTRLKSVNAVWAVFQVAIVLWAVVLLIR